MVYKTLGNKEKITFVVLLGRPVTQLHTYMRAVVV